MKQKSIIFLMGIGALSFIYSFINVDTNAAKEINNHIPSKKGLCWVAGDSVAMHNIDQIADIGANWISQTPFGWMSKYDSPEVKGNFHDAWWGETDRGIKHTAELARIEGIKTMLKPHIWLHGNDGKWRSDIAMNSPEEWDRWFDSYRAWIMHYAVLAEECRIESLCIGTELYQTTRDHPDHWRKIVKDIRSVYNGEVTYAANWYKEYEDLTFWDDLDYIGVQAYFPIAKKENPKKKDLIKSWSKHKSKLKKISDRYDKKIVFTEIGYKNTSDAAIEPWTWPRQSDENTTISDTTQKTCYEALFESVWSEPWFDGIFIWKWFHSTHRHTDFDSYFDARDIRRKQWAKKNNRPIQASVYFTPQRSITMSTLKEWYFRHNN